MVDVLNHGFENGIALRVGFTFKSGHRFVGAVETREAIGVEDVAAIFVGVYCKLITRGEKRVEDVTAKRECLERKSKLSK